MGLTLQVLTGMVAGMLMILVVSLALFLLTSSKMLRVLGVPGVGLIMLPLVFTQVGFPVEGIGSRPP